MIRLVKATPEQGRAVLWLQQKAASKTYRPMDLPAIEQAIAHGRTYMIMSRAVALGVVICKDEGDHILLDEFVVSEVHRGQGVGTQALEAALSLESGRRWELYTHPENPAARLYARYGFKEIGLVEDIYGDGEPRMHMRLEPEEV